MMIQKHHKASSGTSTQSQRPSRCCRSPHVSCQRSSDWMRFVHSSTRSWCLLGFLWGNHWKPLETTGTCITATLSSCVFVGILQIPLCLGFPQWLFTARLVSKSIEKTWETRLTVAKSPCPSRTCFLLSGHQKLPSCQPPDRHGKPVNFQREIPAIFVF